MIFWQILSTVLLFAFSRCYFRFFVCIERWQEKNWLHFMPQKKTCCCKASHAHTYAWMPNQHITNICMISIMYLLFAHSQGKYTHESYGHVCSSSIVHVVYTSVFEFLNYYLHSLLLWCNRIALLNPSLLSSKCNNHTNLIL